MKIQRRVVRVILASASAASDAGAIVLASLCCASTTLSAAEADRQCDPLRSVAELIADPERYDGKLVWVSAMVTTGVEHMSACPSEDDRQNDHCLWVDIEAHPLKTSHDFADYQARLATLERFALQAIAIHATFDSKVKGHFGMWPGGLRNVTELAGRDGGWSYAEKSALPRSACAAKLPEETSGEKLRRGDYEGAITVLDRAIELNPRDSNNWARRAYAKRMKHDYAGAVADYTHLIESEGDEKSPFFWLRGQAREEAGDLGGALADYSRAIELEPNYAGFYRSRALARKKAGDSMGAEADFAREQQLKQGK